MNTKIANYKSGTVLFEKGDNCDSLIAVLDGNIINDSSKSIMANQGDIFGDIYLPLGNNKKKLGDKIIIGGDAVLSMISFKQFQKCIGGDIDSII